MGATLAKEEAEETDEQQQLVAIEKSIQQSKYTAFINYIRIPKLYVAYYTILNGRIDGRYRKPLGYYKTLEEAEKRVDDLMLKLFGKIENEHLIK
jgi:hypothetical protein